MERADVSPLESTKAASIGAIDGAFSVSDSGAATYSIPLTVPPGRQIEPRLSIAYSSDAGASNLGKGFSLVGLSSIHRCGSRPRL